MNIEKRVIFIAIMAILIIVPISQITAFAQTSQPVSCPWFGIFGCSPSGQQQAGAQTQQGIQQPISNPCIPFYYNNGSVCLPQTLSPACLPNTINSQFYFACQTITASICPSPTYTLVNYQCILSSNVVGAVPPPTFNKSSTGLGVSATSGGYLSNAGAVNTGSGQPLGNVTIQPNAIPLGNSNPPPSSQQAGSGCISIGPINIFCSPTGPPQPITNAPPPQAVTGNVKSCPWWGLFGC